MSNKISLRDNITIAELDAFIKQVVSDTFVDVTKPNYLLADMAFTKHFMEMFADTDDNTVIDSLVVYNAYALDAFDEWSSASQLWHYLKELVYKQIDFECKKILAYTSVSSASDEAIEAVSSMAYAGLRAANKLNDVFENLLNITSEEGLLKLLGSEKGRENISHIAGLIGELLAGLIGELSGSVGDVFAQPQTDNVVNFPSSKN